MIIRRFVIALRQQDWTTVAIEFLIVVSGILFALWIDQLNQSLSNSKLELEYVNSLVIDVDADLLQYDETEAWMRRSEAAAAIVLSVYSQDEITQGSEELVAAIETAGWQSWPAISRNTIEDLRSTGNLHLIRDPEIRRSIADYYATVENVSIPNQNIRDRIWAMYDAQVVHVLTPSERMFVLQRPESFGSGVSSDALRATEPRSPHELREALQKTPSLKSAAAEVLYQNITSRAGLQLMRQAAVDLRKTLNNWLVNK